MIEKQLRDVWDVMRHQVRDAQMVADIDEFLNAHEWGLALEHMQEVNVPEDIAKKLAEIGKRME